MILGKLVLRANVLSKYEGRTCYYSMSALELNKKVTKTTSSIALLLFSSIY